MIKVEEQDIHINTGFLTATGGGGEGGASMATDVAVTTNGFQIITGKNVQTALGQVDTKLALNENYDSILLSLDLLSTDIGAITQVPLQSLQTQMHDGRPSHKSAGASVYDEFGTWGVIDTIEGQTANVATLTSRGSQGVTKKYVDEQVATRAEKIKTVENLTSATITLAKANSNTVYKYGKLNSLTVTSIDNSVYGTTIIFTAGSSKPTINLPSTLEKINFVEFEASKKYVIAIENNIAVMGKIGE